MQFTLALCCVIQAYKQNCKIDAAGISCIHQPSFIARARYLLTAGGVKTQVPWYRNHALQSFATVFAVSKLILMSIICLGSSDLSGSLQVS